MKKQMIRFVLVAAIASLIPSAVSAAPITTNNVALTTPGGWYNGSGNPNGAFTQTCDSGVCVYGRAKQRQDPAVVTPVGNVYDVEAGPQVANGGNAMRAWWNYEFGFDLFGTDNLSTVGYDGLFVGDVTTQLTVSDLTTGKSGTVDMRNWWADNTTWGDGGESIGFASYNNTWSAQNSQNPTFFQFPVNLDAPYAFNMFAENYYRVELGVFQNGNLLASNSFDIRVGDAVEPAPVPEPSTWALFGSGAAALVFQRYRRKKS